jgi:hypothetical protein
MGKPIYKSKTMWMAVITMVCGALQGVLQMLSGELGYEGLTLLIVGLIFAFLRTVTNEPLK